MKTTEMTASNGGGCDKDADPKCSSPSSRTRKQSAALLLILLVDLSVLSHMTLANATSPRMYFFWGVKRFHIAYPDRQWTLAHAIFGTIPLVLSLHQLSSVARRARQKVHNQVGYLLVACGLFQIPTTAYLGMKWAEDEVVDVMRAMFVVFAFLWGLWGLIVLYYIRGCNRNIDLHRQWGVRFAVICHYVPIFGRFLTLFIWALYGQPETAEGKIRALQTTIWTLAAIFLPFQELFVWLECGKCWFHSSSPATSRPRHVKDD